MQKKVTDPVGFVLTKLDLHPVLIDVGAAGRPPPVWSHIAPFSTYVGFDPDLRELRELPKSRFRRAVMVNAAVTPAADQSEVLFYLTRSPFCSSTLRPDVDSLSNWLFSDLFEVEKETMVRATSLDSVIERLDLPGIDWLKTDSQGADLRIFLSVPPANRTRMLAVDLEPGLIDAYRGEDLFVDVHSALTREGFWLSNLDVRGPVRMRPATAEFISDSRGIRRERIQSAVKKTPGWVEVRYLRDLNWLRSTGGSEGDHALLWVFAILDLQLGFALDVAREYESAFGQDEVSRVMTNFPLELINRVRYRVKARVSSLAHRMKEVLR